MFVWSKLSSEKWVDAWEERFSGGAQGGLVITAVPNRTTIRLELYCPSEKVAKSVQKEFGGSIREVKNQNWAAMTPEPPGPVKVRNALVICASRNAKERVEAEKRHAGREVIHIPPEMAFGTGHHATTATMLRFLVDVARGAQKEGREWTLGDLGCGSGLLAIAGRRLGAKAVWGCDFDPKAVSVARENAVRNHTLDVAFDEVDVLKWKPKKRYDCIAANLFSDILIQAFPIIVKAVKPGGVVLLSGILHSQSAACLAAGRDAGLMMEKVVRVGKWVSAKAVAGGS